MEYNYVSVSILLCESKIQKPHSFQTEQILVQFPSSSIKIVGFSKSGNLELVCFQQLITFKFIRGYWVFASILKPNCDFTFGYAPFTILTPLFYWEASIYPKY